MKYKLVTEFETLEELAAFVATGMNASVPLVGVANIETPAPAETSMPQSSPSGSVDLDISGLPWDERIHASTKSQTAKGLWSKRRGVDASVTIAIEAELRANTPLPTPAETPIIQTTVAPETPAPSPMPQMDQPTPMQQQPAPSPMPQMDQQAPTPVPFQQPPTPAPVQQQPAGIDYNGFMQTLSTQMQQKDANGLPLVDANYLAAVTVEINTAFGTQFTAITDISTNPGAITFAVQCFQRDGKWD